MATDKPARFVGHHDRHAPTTTTWLTPPYITDALGDFDLDPCGVPGWPTAARIITLPTDGLSIPWHGRVWCNPPYGAQAWTWLNRLADHGNGIALVFARTETAGFVRTVWQRADAVLFLAGRLHFHDSAGVRSAHNAGAPSALVAYGHNNVTALAASGLPGSLVTAWRNVQ